VQYESCRGLEGWCTILDGLDEFWDLRKAMAQSGNNGVPELEAEAVAWRWCMIPITRPIDMLVITLRNETSWVGKVLATLANSMPDVVEFHR
jgi:hypothetical protein